MNFEEKLLALAEHGLPRIAHDGDGWVCSVDMHVVAAGAKFSVRSEFSRATPSIAIDQCIERVEAILKQRQKPATLLEGPAS